MQDDDAAKSASAPTSIAGFCAAQLDTAHVGVVTKIARAMTDEDIPEDVERFLHDHIESFEQLAALALLVRDPSRAWDEEQIARRVHSSVEEAAQALEELCSAGFVVLEIGSEIRTFRYGAKPPASETIERLAQLYSERPLEIMRVMNANAIERVRTSMAKSFASAFVVRRKK